MVETRINASALTESQRRIAALCELKESQTALVSGGFGSGKTTGLALATMLLKARNPGVPGLVLAPNWGTLWSTTVRRIEGLMKQCGWTYKERDKQGECFLDLGDGVPIFLRSAMNVSTFDGLDVGWVVGDEARHWSRQAYEVALGRRRVKCPAPHFFLFSTPQMNWMADEFNQGKEGRTLIVAPTKENAKNLSPGYIDNLRLSYSPRLQKAVIEGIFTILEGAVYENFDPSDDSEWVIDYNPKHHPERKTYLAVDPGYRRSAWLFIHQVSDVQWVVFDQLMLDNTSDMSAVAHVNAKGYPIDEIWTDPAAEATQSVAAYDTIQALGAIKCRTSNTSPICTLVNPWRSIPFGVDKLRVMLGGNGLPIRIKFARRMVEAERNEYRGIIKDLTSYRYPELKDGRPVTDTPLKDGIHDHACLVGCTKVFTDDSGWRRLDELNGSRAQILTPDGLRPISALGKVKEQERVWEICFETGQTTVATGDHPFLVSARCHCGRSLADFSWATVLQMRALLQQANEPWTRVSTSGGLGCCEWCGAGRSPHTPRRRGHEQQQLGQLAAYAKAQTFVSSLKEESAQGESSSVGSGGNVAQIRARQGVAQRAQQGCVGKPEVPGLYLPSVWAHVSVSSQRRGEILPPELQSLCASQASRHQGYHRVSDIRLAGTADVWCASVPSTGAFVLEDGTVSSNTDAIRYWAVGMVLTSTLRSVDPVLAKEGAPGWRVAA